MRQKNKAASNRQSLLIAVIALLLSLTVIDTNTPAFAQDADSKVVNVELILDLSGSMATDLGDGETRMEAAKRVLNEVIDALPESDAVNVGFRIYGHEGDNSNAGRAVSCARSELVVPVDGVDKAALRAQVESAVPTGWTPLARSLTDAEGDFPAGSERVLNNVVLLTDGEETCGGDPCDAAAAIRSGDNQIRTHVIGFAVTDAQSDAINCIAERGEGLNLRAGSASELSEALFSVLQEIEVVEQFGLLEIEAFGDLFPAATASFVPSEGAEPQPPVLLQEINRAEVPAGTYVVNWVNPSGESTQITVAVEPDGHTLIRGSVLRLPQGSDDTYRITDAAGITIWRGELEIGSLVWVLPGVYEISLDNRDARPGLISAKLRTFPGEITGFEVWTAP